MSRNPGSPVRPTIIQGGMGVAISDWRLASAVGRTGQMGVISGTALDVVHARRLADGDANGDLRRAYAAFPVPEVAERVLRRWWIPDGRPEGDRYASVPMGRLNSSASLRELTVLANFAEVWLAKETHDGPIGVNYLEKVQLPTPEAIYGSMLAGVDVVLMGAGIPAAIPRLLTDLAAGRAVHYGVTVSGAAPGAGVGVDFDPASLFGGTPPTLERPEFLAIIASHTLAAFLAKDEVTRPDGFIVEGPTAGGHNAPPRGRASLDSTGQPVYGARDEVDLSKLQSLGLPYWLAGGFADPERVADALQQGAVGVQVGTAFALCAESGLRPDLRDQVIDAARAGDLEVRTDAAASPSGYPFKVAQLPKTLSDRTTYERRERVCDLGYLRTAYQRSDGSIGFRCPSEPVDVYVSKGGDPADTVGRSCLCNGLLATAGYAQVREDGEEPPIVTLGDDAAAVVAALAPETGSWSAADVVQHLLSRVVVGS